MTTDPRSHRARLALEGLSIGDAFGEQLFGHPDVVEQQLKARALPPPPWGWTDDTAMALSVVQVLEERGTVDQDRLAALLTARYLADPRRGYGAGARELLEAIARGTGWRTASDGLFDGRGSYGNGAAMRVAPLGAFFADDLQRCAAEAAASARVTHSHHEGVAGAVAVAVAAAAAATGGPDAAGTLIERALAHTPPGRTRDGIERAARLDAATGRDAAAVLGSGREVSAQDTVPFVLWCADRHLDDFTEAMWTTVDGLGDRDTTCAMVGGIVALAVGEAGIPDEFRRRREPLPADVTAGRTESTPGTGPRRSRWTGIRWPRRSDR